MSSPARQPKVPLKATTKVTGMATPRSATPFTPSAPTKSAVTSLHVARLAQVSQSAVSRTFTLGASVSELTRTKVNDAARQIGYRQIGRASCRERV